MKNQSKPEPTSPPTFESDFRVSNPGLHRLYVGYAYETMEITGRFTEELFDLSRWPASRFAGLVMDAQREEILKDAAWAEAAALMHAHVDFPAWLRANLPNMDEPHDEAAAVVCDPPMIPKDKPKLKKGKRRLHSEPVPLDHAGLQKAVEAGKPPTKLIRDGQKRRMTGE
jgi:hypothetical protein